MTGKLERTTLDCWIWQDYLNGGYRWTIAEKESHRTVEMSPAWKVDGGGGWTGDEARADLARRLEELCS